MRDLRRGDDGRGGGGWGVEIEAGGGFGVDGDAGLEGGGEEDGFDAGRGSELDDDAVEVLGLGSGRVYVQGILGRRKRGSEKVSGGSGLEGEPTAVGGVGDDDPGGGDGAAQSVDDAAADGSGGGGLGGKRWVGEGEKEEQSWEREGAAHAGSADEH